MLRLTPGLLHFYGPVASQALQIYRELDDHVTLPHEIKKAGSSLCNDPSRVAQVKLLMGIC